MINELTENPEEFRRKYGFIPMKGILEQPDPELERMMQKVAQKPSKREKFNEEKFSSTICPGIKAHFKDNLKKKVFLINAVNMDKLSSTEKAFFLSSDSTREAKLLLAKANAEAAATKQGSTTPAKVPTDGKEVVQGEQITGSQAQASQQNVEQDEDHARQKNANVEERNECVCKKGWNGEVGEKMIACDGVCKEWYHPVCIGMTKCELNIIDSNSDVVWMCRACVKKLASQKTKNSTIAAE